VTDHGNVAVVVLGDVARSPRMLAHALSFANTGHIVSLIGYRGYPLPAEAESPRIRLLPLHPLPPSRQHRTGIRFVVWSSLRMSLVAVELFLRLMGARARRIVVQNPPSFPTLLAAWLAARLCRARLIVDWHNYGYSIMALRLGASHRLVRLAEWYEETAGRRADAHLCVSRHLRDDLARREITAQILYDRPLAYIEPDPRPSEAPLLVVCPAGWTADEDIGMLLDALDACEGAAAMDVWITGDGPLRQEMEQRIADRGRRAISVRTGYLPAAQYRALVARAGLGISLHRSSSQLDLAMKVVDLFAARVPVAAYDYGDCLREQVDPGRTGVLFRTAAELADQLRRFSADRAALNAMRAAITEDWKQTWHQAWSAAREALP